MAGLLNAAGSTVKREPDGFPERLPTAAVSLGNHLTI